MNDQAAEPVAWIPKHEFALLQAHGFVHAELTSGSASHRVALYLAPPSESTFKAAVLDALTINWALKAEHNTDARLAVADLIAAETRIALDPAVSSDAQALIDKSRASERERTIMAIDLATDYLNEVRASERERIAAMIEGGRFLHHDAPDAKFGRAVAAAIRELGDG